MREESAVWSDDEGSECEAEQLQACTTASELLIRSMYFLGNPEYKHCCVPHF